MQKRLMKINRVLQVVLMAPIKLPGKALNILKYIALGLGVVETVLEDKDEKDRDEPTDQGSQVGVKDDLSTSDFTADLKKKVFSSSVGKPVLLNKEFTTGKERIDETE